MEREGDSRRSFLGKAAAGAAVVAAGTAATTRAQKLKSASEPFRVGCLNVMSYSHLPALWGPIINPRAGEKDTPFTNLRITHCWDIEYDKAKEFAKMYGCEVVKNHDDMLDKVDGVISGGYYNHGWNHIIHAPYLEAGLPNLINRPFANSLAKAKKIIDMASRHNAPILVPSAHEHNEAIVRAKDWAAGKNILCYNATNATDDYPTHGVHGLYLVCKAIAEAGNPVVSVSFTSKNWYTPPGVMTFEHRNKEGNSFFGTLHQVGGSWGTIRIHTPEVYGGEDFLIRIGKGYPFSKTEVWAPTIWAYQNMALYGEMPQTFEQILHKTNAFMAGWRSVLVNEGKPVRLEDVPEDWESPVELPNQPQDTTVTLFKKKFG